eukprot:COSAG02_NODE_58200_length_278_cov_0.581006_1_plen_87_part_01
MSADAAVNSWYTAEVPTASVTRRDSTVVTCWTLFSSVATSESPALEKKNNGAQSTATSSVMAPNPYIAFVLMFLQFMMILADYSIYL